MRGDAREVGVGELQRRDRAGSERADACAIVSEVKSVGSRGLPSRHPGTREKCR